MGIEGLQKLRAERRNQKQNERIDKMMGSICKRLSMENFLKSLVPIYFTTHKFEVGRAISL